MLDAIIKSSLKNRLLVVIAAIGLLVAGAFVVTQIPIDVFPDLTAPTVVILTEAHGMATEEVETMVTFQIETSVNGATGVRRVRSSSSMGISIVWVEFDWGTDIFIARQIVNEKLQLLSGQLPRGVSPPVLAPISSIMGEIMLVSVSSGTHSELDVRTVADWTIRRRLLAVPGVSQVVPIGGGRKQYQVLVDPDKLIAYRLSVHDVLRAVEASNTNSSCGVFMEKGQEYLIRGMGMEWDDLDEDTRTMLGNRMLVGGPDTIGELVQEKILGQGLDAVTVNIPAGGHLPEVVARAGEVLAKAMS